MLNEKAGLHCIWMLLLWLLTSFLLTPSILALRNSTLYDVMKKSANASLAAAAWLLAQCYAGLAISHLLCSGQMTLEHGLEYDCCTPSWELKFPVNRSRVLFSNCGKEQSVQEEQIARAMYCKTLAKPKKDKTISASPQFPKRAENGEISLCFCHHWSQ